MLKTKNSYIFLTIIFLFISIYILEYRFILYDINNYFSFNNTVKLETLNEEKEMFFMNLNLKVIVYIFQFMIGFLCINTGMLYFKHQIKIEKIIKIIFFSFTAYILTEYIAVILLWVHHYVFTTTNINNINNKLNLAYYLQEYVADYLMLPLKIINFSHLIFFLTLTYGVKKITNISYYKSYLFTVKTYGVGVFIILIFAVIMELNFNLRLSN